MDAPSPQRLEGAIDAFGIARLEALRGLPGNPLELRIERFGHVVAPAAAAAPELDFVNRITALGPGDVDRLPNVLAFYGGLGLRPWLEVTPGVVSDLDVGTALVGFQTTFYGAPGGMGAGVPVRESDDTDRLAQLLLEAFGVPPEIVSRHAPALATATAAVGGRFFVAEVEGVPVAAAILTMHDGDGYLAMAGTLPPFRGRGLQGALIAARLDEAAREGCELAVATAEFGSQSQRNLERAGLRIAYTKPVLRLSPTALEGEPGRAGTA